MKVIIDSNILYDNSYSKKLKREIINLIQECNNLGVTIVIPTTVITEVNRKQRELGKKLEEEIKKSINFLKAYQINTEEFDISKIVSDISIVDKFAENKISIEIVEPTLEIYVKAHEIAAEHRAPCIKKEDEMRDLIIWEIACEISRKEGGALIISDDKLFWGDQGDEIANEVNLTRVRTVDDALGVLEIGTPARSKAEAILKDIWINLTKPPLPLDNGAKIKRLYDASFIEGDHGITYASFHASIANNNEN